MWAFFKIVQPPPPLSHPPIYGTFLPCFGSGSGLDPYSTRSADPDPGGQKWPTKKEKKLAISWFQVLDVFFWGLKASPAAQASFLSKKISKIFWSSKFFPIFCHQNTGSGSAFRSEKPSFFLKSYINVQKNFPRTKEFLYFACSTTWTDDLFAMLSWGYFGNFLLILLALFRSVVKIRHFFKKYSKSADIQEICIILFWIYLYNLYRNCILMGAWYYFCFGRLRYSYQLIISRKYSDKFS